MFEFFEAQHLDPATLRRVSQHQIGVLAAQFDGLDLDPTIITRDRSMPQSELGGFLALRSPRAMPITKALQDRGILTDARGEILRFGPAPYLSDSQLQDAMAGLREAARSSL